MTWLRAKTKKHFSHTKCDFQYGSDSSKVTICPLPRQKCFSWRGDHWGRMGQAMEKPHVVHYELRHSNSTTDITTEERRPKKKSFSNNSSFASKHYVSVDGYSFKGRGMCCGRPMWPIIDSDRGATQICLRVHSSFPFLLSLFSFCYLFLLSFFS